MKLETRHIRLIRQWFEAARDGRVLIMTNNGGYSPALRERMREIESANPSLFPQEA